MVSQEYIEILKGNIESWKQDREKYKESINRLNKTISDSEEVLQRLTQN